MSDIEEFDHTLYRRLSSRTLNWSLAIAGLAIITLGVALMQLEFSVRATGYLYQRGERYLYSPDTGLIAERFLDQGDFVTEGQPILRLANEALETRRDDLLRELEQLRSARDEAVVMLRLWEVDPARVAVETSDERRAQLEAIVRRRRDTVERLESLDGSQAVSGLMLEDQRIQLLQSEIDLIESRFLNERSGQEWTAVEKLRREQALEQAETQIATVETMLQRVEERIDGLVVRAPISGRIIRFDRKYEGEALQPGDYLLTLVPADAPFVARLFAGERNVDQITVGRPVRMKLEVYNAVLEGYLYGTVVEVGLTTHPTQGQANTANGIPQRLYEVKVMIEESPYDPIHGASVDGRVILGQRNLFETFFNLGRKPIRAPAPDHDTRGENDVAR